MTGTKDLRQFPLFAAFSEAEIREISRCMERKTFRKKDAIFSEGDSPTWFYILVGGKVKITKVSREGKEIIVELISPGEFFGGFAVLKGFPYPANAVAMENSEVLRIARRDLLGIIERFPNLMYAITAHLSERVREFPDALKKIALERVEARIAALLLKLAEKTGERTNAGEIGISIRLTKQDIAEMAGTTVETSIRVLSRFKKSGYIKEANGKIIIRNEKVLKEIAHS